MISYWRGDSKLMVKALANERNQAGVGMDR
jgi:hypothetical protein